MFEIIFRVLDVETWDQILSEQQNQPVSGSSNSDIVIDMEGKSYLKFDVISCLNLLDRCENPITLLNKIRNALKPDGRLVVALVLPFKPYVEYNSGHKPKEYLFDTNKASKNETTSIVDCDLASATDKSSGTCSQRKMSKLNEQIKYLLDHVFEPNGFELVKFTKLPYLCEGNMQQSYYYMLDYVFIFKLK
jgi:2-polyprenyl-3-methyl-5-hydroxy-6-metoxy-1,4-benzoquinol methylase